MSKLEKLVVYFRKRAAENQRRAKAKRGRRDRVPHTEAERAWFDCKADTYARCADKLEEVLREEATC